MATKYLVSGGSGTWSNSNNWSLTSGGASGAGAPNAVDDVIFDANSSNAPMTVNITSNCTSVFMSGYTGTMTYVATLNVLNSFEYSSGMNTVGGGFGLGLGNNTSTPSATCSVNFNGVFHNGVLSFNNTNGANCVYTITGDLHVGSTVTFANSNLGGAGAKATLNGGNIYCYAGFGIYGNGNRWVNGTSDIYFVGGGSGNFTSGPSSYIQVPITFAKTGGTINMTVGALYPRGSTVTYVSGNFTNFIIASNVSTNTFDTNNLVLSAFSCAGGAFNLSSQLNVSGTFSNTVSSTIGGTGGINCRNLTTTNNLLFPTGSTTTISGTLTAVATAAAPFTIGSVSSGSKANMILSNTGNQDVAHVYGRDIDSDGGTTIYSYRSGSIVRCDNWSTLPIITSINTNSILR